ncbi:MAG: hypothetical protein LBB88_10265 [Planctomycetaceae bacterium]|nr:hypothetical protein [Planctomycetaceae bacterium]
MPCVSLFDQKITDRDAKHCVSTLGLVIQIRIKIIRVPYEQLRNSDG